MAQQLKPEMEDNEQIEGSVFQFGRSPRFERKIHELRKVHFLARSTCDPPQFQQYVVVSPNYHVSRTPLKNLEQISLRQLSVDRTYHGGYLILRTLEILCAKQGIYYTIVEDHEGDGAILKIFNFKVNPNEKFEDGMPVGTVLALKEPFCSESIKGDCILNCESPSDMIVVYDGYELSRLTNDIFWKCNIEAIGNTSETANRWEELGDGVFNGNNKQHMAATSYYYQALKNITQVVDKVSFRNDLNLKLGLVYADRGFHETALKFLEKVLKFEPRNSGAITAAGNSCYSLGRYAEAFGYFRTCLSESDNKKMLHKCMVRIGEMKNGLKNVHKLAATPVNESSEVADYTGHIHLTAIEGKGRGVVATTNIEPGTLLVISKALAFSKYKVEDDGDVTRLEYWHDLLLQLSEKISSNPNTFGPIIYSLCDGKSPGGVGDPPITFCDPKKREEPIVDMAKLKDIIDSNMMGDGTSETKNGYGVFEWPSYFNHCCQPNTSIHRFNDVMVIRATKSIKMGEEACLPCYSSDTLLHLKIKLCSTRGVQCSCRFCWMDGEISDHKGMRRSIFAVKYKDLYLQLATEVDIGFITRETRCFIGIIEYFNLDHDPYIREMVLPAFYTLLAKAIAMTTKREKKLTETKVSGLVKEIECHGMVLKYSGFKPSDMLKSLENNSELIPPNACVNKNVLLALVGIISNYNSLENVDYTEKWISILIALEMIYSGGDCSVLQLQYPHIHDLLINYCEKRGIGTNS